MRRINCCKTSDVGILLQVKLLALIYSKFFKELKSLAKYIRSIIYIMDLDDKSRI